VFSAQAIAESKMPELDSNWTSYGITAEQIVARAIVATLLRRLANVLGIELPAAFSLLQRAVINFDLNELIESDGAESSRASRPPVSKR
jgi:hypothetical protein